MNDLVSRTASFPTRRNTDRYRRAWLDRWTGASRGGEHPDPRGDLEETVHVPRVGFHRSGHKTKEISRSKCAGERWLRPLDWCWNSATVHRKSSRPLEDLSQTHTVKTSGKTTAEIVTLKSNFACYTERDDLKILILMDPFIYKVQYHLLYHLSTI